MNKYTLKVLTLIAFIMVLFLPGCKTTEVVKYTLTVDLGAGVTGTPVSGSYQKEQDEVISYSYTLEPGYKNLLVTLDGTALAPIGSFTVTGNHNLSVTAEELLDIRGEWTAGKFVAKTWSLTAIFSGEIDSGDVDCEIGVLVSPTNGKYTVDDINVSFWIWYYNSKLDFIGTAVNNNKMSGTWKVARTTPEGNGKIPSGGSWELTRN